MNITEDYVSFETAKLLKEKGFDEGCDKYYPIKGGEVEELTLDELNYHRSQFIKAPTHQMAMKWLREVHSIVITIDLRKVNQGKGWGYIAVIHTLEKDFDTELLYADYAHCINEVIKYTLENLI